MSRHHAPRLLSLPAALISCFVLTAPGAWAQAPATGGATQASAAPLHLYKLEAGPLARTLQSIAATTGQRIVYDDATVADMQAAPVNGNLSASAAVATALGNTGLQLNDDGGATLTIVPTLAVVVRAQRGQGETSFKADRTDTVTRSGASLHDVPASATILTGKLLESQQVTNLQDALRNVSGIAFTQSPQSTPTFKIRGFSASATTNGVSDASAAQTNVFGIERVEVLKGPQAILAGANGMGGGVNVVMKKPQADDIRDVMVQYGSYADRTVAGDISGALTDDKKLTYRVIGSSADAKRSQGGFKGREDDFLLTALRWKDENTDAVVGLSYGNTETPPALATFARRDGVILPAPAIVFGNQDDAIDVQTKRAYYSLERKLTPSITLVSRMQRSLTDIHLHLYSPGGLGYATGAATNNPRTTMSISASPTDTPSATTSGDHFLRAEFDTWGIGHKFVVGINHSEYNSMQTQWYSGSQTISPFTGVQPSFIGASTFESAAKLNSTASYRQKETALYFQDMLSYGDWNLLLNVRRSLYELAPAVTNYVSSNFLYTQAGKKSDANIPGIGVVYKVTPDTSVYASLARGFNPQNSLQCGGGFVAPITTQNKEIGVKMDMLDGKLSLTTSAYSLLLSNQLLYNTPSRCYDVRDAQKTRGIEIDLQGQLARGWNAVANYSYTSIEDTAAGDTIYPGQPRNKMSLWTTYEFPEGQLKGFGGGFGVTASTNAPGTYSAVNQFTLPGQAQIDANVSYHNKKWDLTLGVKNLADRLLYGSSSSASYVPILAGRTVMFTARRSFK